MPAETLKVRDRTAAEALIDAMIGWTAVGADSDGNEVSRKTSPEVRAHLDAVLGENCMNWGGDTKPGRREAMAAYLRSVADVLSPIQAQPAPAPPSTDRPDRVPGGQDPGPTNPGDVL